MKILFTGYINKYSNEIFEPLLEDNEVVLFGDCPHVKKRQNLTVISASHGDEDRIRDIYAAYEIDMVIFSSRSIDGNISLADDLERFEINLHQMRVHNVKNLIVLYTNAQDVPTNHLSARRQILNILKNAMIELCRNSVYTEEMGVSFLRIPNMYATSPNGWEVSNYFKTAAEGGEVKMKLSFTKDNDFLAEKDLGELLARIADTPVKDEFAEMNLYGGNLYSADEIEDLILDRHPYTRFSIDDKADARPGILQNDAARDTYSWFPKHSFKDDIDDFITAAEADVKYSVDDNRVLSFFRRHSKTVRISLEVVFTVVVAQLLNNLIKDNVTLNFLDFRLIGVMIMGSLNGLGAGIVTGIACSFLYLIEAHQSMTWQLILFNAQNWLPFAAYLFLGSVGGYTHDKHEENIKKVNEEYDVLENKYEFLLGLYNKILKSNTEFNQQIIGYQNSYGKIYQMVKALDVADPDSVVFAAVSELEDMLESHSIAIFFGQEKSDFARLAACSREVSYEVPKSVNVKDYSTVVAALQKGSTFVNRDNVAKLPSFAAPILDEGKVMGTIAIIHSTDEQMNVEFANKLFIITDLAAASLIRANKAFYSSENFIENTRIRTAESMHKIFEARSKLADKSYIHDVIFHVEIKEINKFYIDALLGKLVRSNDEYGYGSDGELYIILQQAGNDVERVKDRFIKAGLKVTQVGEVP